MMTEQELKMIGDTLQHFVQTYGARSFDVAGSAFAVATIVQREMRDVARQQTDAKELAKFRADAIAVQLANADKHLDKLIEATVK